MKLVDELTHSFRKGIVFRLIYINVAIFILIWLAFVFYRIFTPGIGVEGLRTIFNERFLTYLMVPSLPGELLVRPWTLITYMFTHSNFFHILFNMLMLYWFGQIFLQYLTAKQLVSTYVLGGLAGALLYILLINGFPGLRDYLGSDMLGASAAIMAIVIAISFYVPDYTIYMLLIGPVRLKYVAIFFIVLDILMIGTNNAGGHIAHLGGAIYGFWFIRRFKKGHDTGNWVNKILDKLATLFKPRRHLNVSYRKGGKIIPDADYNLRKVNQQKEVDRILDKIAKAGYESLTKAEKEILFKMGSNKP
jgi:membrane associated rhomboid family serine protease